MSHIFTSFGHVDAVLYISLNIVFPYEINYASYMQYKTSHPFIASLMQYKAEEPVKLWVNKVGPYNNPQETYNYYSLPFCQPSENPIHKWGGLGEVLGGNELIDSQLDIKFLSMLILFPFHPCLYLLLIIMSIYRIYATFL